MEILLQSAILAILILAVARRVISRSLYVVRRDSLRAKMKCRPHSLSVVELHRMTGISLTRLPPTLERMVRDGYLSAIRTDREGIKEYVLIAASHDTSSD